MFLSEREAKSVQRASVPFKKKEGWEVYRVYCHQQRRRRRRRRPPCCRHGPF